MQYLLEFAPILFQKVIQEYKPMCVPLASTRCFYALELVRTPANVLRHEQHEHIVFDE